MRKLITFIFLAHALEDAGLEVNSIICARFTKIIDSFSMGFQNGVRIDLIRGMLSS